MSSDMEHLKENLSFIVARVRASLQAPGFRLSKSELSALAEELDSTIGSIGTRNFDLLCPNLANCNGSCFTAEQGVWKATRDVLFQGFESVLCSPTSTDLMLEPILSLLCTLQQLPCGALNQHLQDIFKFLSERVLFLTATDGQTAALSSCKLTVFRQLLTLQKLGDKHTQKLTATFRAFNDSLVSSSHPNNWCKSLNTADRVVLLFVELITGKPWLEPAFRHKLTSSLQTQATDSETHLANLWMYLAEALQDREFLDACNGIIAYNDMHPGKANLADDAKARHVGKCAHQLLAEIGSFLPDTCTMAAVSGALDLLANPGREQLSVTVFAGLCGLFVSPETLELILASLFLQNSTSSKGCLKAVESVLELVTAPEECLLLLRLLLEWSGVEQNAPVECRAAALEGYRACLELLQSDAFCKVPVAAHATKLQVVFSQDSSTKVRRAGFRAWLCLQELCQGSYDCNDWDIEALQVNRHFSVLGCETEVAQSRKWSNLAFRDKQIQSAALQVLEPLSSTRLRQLLKLEELYYMMYHAAQRKQEYTHEAVLALVKATLTGCPEALARRFHKSMMHAVAEVKEEARKAVLAHMCHQLVLKNL